jgi:tetraprenyl-beta-curcumene synthase
VFAAAAFSYWLDVFPSARGQLRHWRRQARAIPDPRLRDLAVTTLAAERGNLEGAAAFAVLAPRVHRREVTRAAVAFQALYDYVDTLAEQPVVDPLAHGRAMHSALPAALDPSLPHADYYEHAFSCQDGGYVERLIESCRTALGGLPSFDAVRPSALAATCRMVDYQALNHTCSGDRAGLRNWADGLTPPDCDLRWWEAAAGAASSMGVFALMAAAGRPGLTRAQAEEMESAYFPWVGALHVLLDSLVDWADDLDSGDHSLVEHYCCPQEAARRLAGIAEQALTATGEVAQSAQHALILAAMASFYLARPTTLAPAAQPAATGVLQAFGSLATPAVAVLRVRDKMGRLEGLFGALNTPICGHPGT